MDTNARKPSKIVTATAYLNHARTHVARCELKKKHMCQDSTYMEKKDRTRRCELQRKCMSCMSRYSKYVEMKDETPKAKACKVLCWRASITTAFARRAAGQDANSNGCGKMRTAKLAFCYTRTQPFARLSVHPVGPHLSRCCACGKVSSLRVK